MQIAKHWRLKGSRYRLEGARDPQTGALAFPPPANADWEIAPLDGRGVVESFASVGRAADGFADGAVMALVRLNDGPLITAQLTDQVLRGELDSLQAIRRDIVRQHAAGSVDRDN